MYYWISDWTSEIMLNKREIDLSQFPKRQLHVISITFDVCYFQKLQWRSRLLLPAVNDQRPFISVPELILQ